MPGGGWAPERGPEEVASEAVASEADGCRVAVELGDDLLAMVSDAMSAGASGVVIGHKVWQRPIEEAARLLGQLYAIVH